MGGLLGIEIAKRALAANQYAMDVTGNNIANVNTPGYSRQEADIQNSTPVMVPVNNVNKPMASLGTGASLVSVTRVRDSFLDQQMRGVNQDSGNWNQQQVNLGQIESIFNEPSDTGIAANLTNFWSSFQGLASPDPSSSGARSNVVSSAQILASSLQQTRSQLTDLQASNDKDVQLKVQQVNDLADQIASLNGQIVNASASSEPNDLLDKRNVLVGQLSQLVNIDYYEDPRGSSTIAVGGVFVVADQTANHMTTKVNPLNNGFSDVVWQNEGSQVDINNGELNGLIQSRDTTTTQYISFLDNMATTMMTAVNNQQRAGYTLTGESGQNLFTGTSAGDIAVSTEIANDLSKIAASSRPDNAAGNGDNATLLADVGSKAIFDSNTTSVNQTYQNMISNLGTQSAQAQTYVNTNEGLNKQLTSQIASNSGVSIDEEMTNMIQFQHGYTAAAKYMQTMSDVMTTLM